MSLIFLGPGPIIYGIIEIIEFSSDDVDAIVINEMKSNYQILKYLLIELFPILTILSLVSYEFVYRRAKKEISNRSSNDPDFSVGVLKFKDIANPGQK